MKAKFELFFYFHEQFNTSRQAGSVQNDQPQNKDTKDND